MPMSLAQLADIVTRTIGKTDAAAIALCKDFIRRRYAMIYDSANWRETELVLSFSVAANTQEVIIPNTMERVKAVRWDGTGMVWPTELATLFEQDPGIFDRTGTPVRFAELATVGVATAPGGKVISVVSSSSADTGLTISVRGEVGTTETEETITTNGTTAASGTVLWDRIFLIGKPETTGTISVTNSDGTALVSLWAKERCRQHVRIWLQETPNQAKTMHVLGKRRMRELWNDADCPILRNIDNALMAYVQGDMLEYAKQYAKAQLKQQEGHAHLAIMRNLDAEQSGRVCQITPVYSGEWARGDFNGGRNIF